MFKHVLNLKVCFCGRDRSSRQFERLKHEFVCQGVRFLIHVAMLLSLLLHCYRSRHLKEWYCHCLCIATTVTALNMYCWHRSCTATVRCHRFKVLPLSSCVRRCCCHFFMKVTAVVTASTLLRWCCCCRYCPSTVIPSSLLQHCYLCHRFKMVTVVAESRHPPISIVQMF